MRLRHLAGNPLTRARFLPVLGPGSVVSAMWVPSSEDDIKAAIANGILTETATFDAKEALPSRGKNKDLAKDICAMTVDGGLLLYGVGGKDPTRPDTLRPFD